MIYNFDEVPDRQGTNSVKYDLRTEVFGNEKVIPMWVADMDFRTPPFIIDALRKRLEHEILGYTFRGDDYFNSLVKWAGEKYGWTINKDWVMFSPGIVPAVNMCTLAYTEPGDSIIVQPPVYFPFFGAVKDHGRKLMFNRLAEKNGRYYFDLNDLEKKAKSGAKMLILSNPHNPVGRAWTTEELTDLAGICLRYNVLIISDEIHADLVLPAYKHRALAAISEEIASQTITCYAPSKTFNLAGLSTSSLVIPDKDLRGKYQAQIDSLHIGGGNIFGTEASVAAYSHGEDWLRQLLSYLEKNIALVLNSCDGEKLPIKALVPEATYMIWLDCRRMEMSGKELENFFINKAGIGMNEGSMFGPGGEGYMRMNIACPGATVEKALHKIENAIRSI